MTLVQVVKYRVKDTYILLFPEWGTDAAISPPYAFRL